VTRAIRVTAPRFLMVGALNTLVGLSVIFMAKAIAGAGDVTANVAGYGVGFVLSFLLNRTWTFGHRGDRWSAMGRFLLVFAVAYALNLAVVLLLVRGLQLNGYLSQMLGVVPYTVFSYFAARHLVFRDRGA